MDHTHHMDFTAGVASLAFVLFLLRGAVAWGDSGSCDGNKLTNVLSLFIPFEPVEVVSVGEFNTSGCEKPKTGWIEMLLFEQPIEKQYSMSKFCDVEGLIKYSRSPFSVELKLKNLGKLKKMKLTAEYIIKPESGDALQIRGEISNGRIHSDKKVEFAVSGEYVIVVSRSGQVLDNKGGTFKLASTTNSSKNLQCAFKSKIGKS